ncbi:MAG: hypothetical protein ABFD00_02295 [Chloroherpetonaceae bacterium]
MQYKDPSGLAPEKDIKGLSDKSNGFTSFVVSGNDLFMMTLTDSRILGPRLQQPYDQWGLIKDHSWKEFFKGNLNNDCGLRYSKIKLKH